jgi:methionyl-tRNA formyltransferase
MKIAFFGTPAFTVEFLELFKKIGLDIGLIVTGEDKPVGRGMQMRSPGPKVWGEHTLPKGVLQPKKLDNDFYNTLKEMHDQENFDLFIVIAYGKIIPERIINLPKYGTINLHYSLLPKYRGASPVETAILNGDTETGITIQQMVYKLDAGNILFQEKVDIGKDETTSELRERMNKRALEIFPDFLKMLSLTPSPSPKERGERQDESITTSCGKFIKDDLNVTKEIEKKDFEMLYRKYRAFDKKVFFWFSPHFEGGARGGLIRVKISEMNANEILKVVPESRKEMTLKEYENGFGKIF